MTKECRNSNDALGAGLHRPGARSSIQGDLRSGSVRARETRAQLVCAWILVGVTFPLVWVGGLVTTTGAGMAFPDWLTSDGHFILFYPWLSSVGDKFVEHGHRLLGVVVGIVSIVLVVVSWITEPRSWVRKFSLVILGGVILQGVLGGLRVVLDERTLALAHGCTGPLFFALCAAMVVFTSRWWKNVKQSEDSTTARKILRLAVLCAVLAYLQIVVGAVVRHSPQMTAPIAAAIFQLTVYFHVLLALLVTGHVLLLAWRCISTAQQRAIALVLVALTAIQLSLGAGTWIAKYGMPAWATSLLGEVNFVNSQADVMQSSIVTSHVAVGSLLFVISVAIALRSGRQSRIGLPQMSVSSARNSGVAL